MKRSSHLASIPRTEDAPRQARRLVSTWTSRVDVPEEVTENALLLVSEIVTNAVIHQRNGEPIELSADIDSQRLRVSVTSHGAALHDDARPTGWGLTIVDLVADRWAIDSIDPTVVWFELSRR